MSYLRLGGPRLLLFSGMPQASPGGGGAASSINELGSFALQLLVLCSLGRREALLGLSRFIMDPHS